MAGKLLKTPAMVGLIGLGAFFLAANGAAANTEPNVQRCDVKPEVPQVVQEFLSQQQRPLQSAQVRNQHCLP